MAEGLKANDLQAWCHTFALIASIRNTTASKQNQVTDPLQFYPHEKPTGKDGKEQRVTSGVPLTRGNVVQILGSAFGLKP